jgi:hypothetical protein
VSAAPVDWQSSEFISFINAWSVQRLHPDFGGELWPGSAEVFGMPFVVVDASQPKRRVRFEYANESDGVDHSTMESFPFYPIPDEAIGRPRFIQGGWPGNVDRRGENDRHMLILDVESNYLYELFCTFFNEQRWEWEAVAGAFFDLTSTRQRPDQWGSADAAGMPMLPFLVKYDEVYGPNEIDHAFRVTVRVTNGYTYPASHLTHHVPGALPLGARLRLKPDTDISSFPPGIQKIFRAMKKYGLIVADNGPDMMVSGAFDLRWDNGVLNPAFHSLTASDFEVVQLGYGAE